MADTLTILAVDDMKENLDIILDILDNYDVIPAINAKTALKILEEENISLILLDIVMPNMNGIEACKQIKAQASTKDIPIIFTTSQTDEDSISSAYEAGANDYVCKPLKCRDVIARVNTQLKLKKTIEDLEYLASRDTMTGIYNRRKFFELATSLFNENVENFFLVTIDIDFFKKVNDNFGHDAGDFVIKRITQIICDSLPNDSIFARMGGEEFVVIISNEKNEKDVVSLFENIRNKIFTETINYNGNIINTTVSAGIVQRTNNNKTIDEVVKNSDLALYEAKKSGRNKVIYR